MNVLELLTARRDLDLNRVAFHSLGSANGSIRFGELLGLAAGAQRTLRESGRIASGDRVLLADRVSPALYASVIALLGMGATVILVEPFLPVAEIDRLIARVAPKAFLASRMGMAWGLRTASIRKIPRWINPGKFRAADPSKLDILSLDPAHPGTVAFSSGTTGRAKGVVRTHGALQAQNRIITGAGNLDRFRGPDLAIFANLVLANLAIGRGSIFVPPPRRDRLWGKALDALGDLPPDLRPETLTCGPAFLDSLLARPTIDLSTLRSIHVGGALTDLATFERGFARFPEARWAHVYGSSEAEPVAISDARESVAKSRARGYFQALSLGAPISEIRATSEAEGLWVAGPHVGAFYLENEEENRRNKRKDADGSIWHFMGDRVCLDSDGAWFRGRSAQSEEDFLLEQKIYARLGSSASFVHRAAATGERVLVGEGLRDRADEIRRAFPEIERVVERTIARDRRHRARIDRPKTLGSKRV